jgi:CRP-like cAMP-binding protein
MVATVPMLSREAVEEFLSAPWLAELDTAARHALMNVMEEHHSPVGELLLDQGQPNDQIIFLMKGVVSVDRKHPDGRTEKILTLDAPSIFGLTSFFRPTPPNFSVKAKSPVWYLTLDHPAHNLLRKVDVRASEQLALACVRVLSERFDLLDRRLSENLAGRPSSDPKVTEWAQFRARLLKNNI